MALRKRLVLINGYRVAGHGGGILVTRAITEALLDYNPNVVLLGAIEDATHPLARRASVYVPIPRASLPRKLLAVMSGRAMDRTFLVADRWLRQHLKADDMLVLNGAIVGRYAKFSRHCVTIHHNIEMDYYSAELQGSPGKSFLVRIASRNQACALSHAKRNMFLTDADRIRAATLFPDADPASLSYMQPFVPSEESKVPCIAGDLSFSSKPRLLITGSLDNPQVRIPLINFITRVLPVLRREFPGISVTAAGKNPRADIHQLCSTSGVCLVASPTSTDHLFEATDVYLGITEQGSGIKLRLIDALRWALPALAHTCSAVGFANPGFPWIRTYGDQATMVHELAKLLGRGHMPLSHRVQMQNMFLTRFSFHAQAPLFNEICTQSVN